MKFHVTIEREAMVTLRSKYFVEADDADEAERLVRAEAWQDPRARIVLESDEIAEVHLAHPPADEEKALIEELPIP